jgi:DHA2 family multidrug resistance protein-like MFS transporter
MTPGSASYRGDDKLLFGIILGVMWSMGSWGGSGFAALFGGLMAENVGWRWIFFASAAVSAAGMLMVRGTPESKAAVEKDYRFDTMGVLTFMVTMLALQVLATQGSEIGCSC